MAMSADMKPSMRENIATAPADNQRKALGLAPCSAVNKRLNDCRAIAALRPPDFPVPGKSSPYRLHGRLLMTRKVAFGMALSGMLLALTACGYSPGTRAVSGGLLG